jgi:uncharacterized membrane protein
MVAAAACDNALEVTMSTMQLVKLYLLTAVVFFAIDLVWLGVVAAGFYQRQLGHLLAEQVRWIPALLFYLLFIGGLLVFAVLPALAAGSLVRALALGALLGLVAYATFDLTCLALFREFPLRVVCVDLVWGACLSAAVSAAGYGIGRWLGLGG